MSFDKYTTYSKDHAITLSIKNALVLKPRWTSTEEKKFIFTIEAQSSFKVYNMYINDVENKITATNCTCPFTFEGICNHTAAALKILVVHQPQNNLFNEPSKPQSTKTSLKKNQVFLPNGIISDSLFDGFSNVCVASSYDNTSIKQKTDHFIITELNSWRNEKQRFEFDLQTNVLTMFCESTIRHKITEYILKSLREVVYVYGNEVFTANYLSNKIGAHLANFNLTSTYDYSKLFKYDIPAKGFVVGSKYKNIQSKVSSPAPLLKDESEEKSMYLPEMIDKNSAFAIIVCFEFNKNEHQKIKPFEGKLNKLKTNFSSGLQAIDEYNIFKSLQNFTDLNDQRLIIQLHQINELAYKYYSTNTSTV